MRKRYTTNQKAQIVLEILKEEQTIAQIASAHGVHPTQLRKWKTQVLEGLPHLFNDDKKTIRALEAAHERELDELYAEIGRLTTQLVAQHSTVVGVVLDNKWVLLDNRLTSQSDEGVSNGPTGGILPQLCLSGKWAGWARERQGS